MKVKLRVTTVTVTSEWHDFKDVDELLEKIDSIECEGNKLVACINDKGESLVGGVWQKIERTKRK